MTYDLLIQGGTVIDPSQSLHAPMDVAISNGVIAELAPSLDASQAATTVDARDQLVIPGLIDLHVHVYHRHVPISLEPDSLCAAGGVTTMLDAGSAGSLNFDGFCHDILEPAETQLFGLVNLSCMGLIVAHFGELMDRRYADPVGVVETIARHPDLALGVKIRAGRHIIGDGQMGRDNFMDAVRAARESGTWLMVHIGESPMTIPEMLEQMQPGDCITHCFKSGSERILDPDNRVFDAVREAADRGVIFDVGHGRGSFQWEVVEAAIEQGFEPSTISTDLHQKNINGPVYDMPTTMSKFLMLGCSLDRVVEMSTTVPARVLGKQDQLGTLKVGSVADVAVLERRRGSFLLSDSHDEMRTGSELLVAAATVRRGELLPGGGGTRMFHGADV
jgi:dihydroorotase